MCRSHLIRSRKHHVDTDCRQLALLCGILWCVILHSCESNVSAKIYSIKQSAAQNYRNRNTTIPAEFFSFSFQYFSHVIGRFSYNADSVLYSFTKQGFVVFWENNQELRMIRNLSSTQET